MRDHHRPRHHRGTRSICFAVAIPAVLVACAGCATVQTGSPDPGITVPDAWKNLSAETGTEMVAAWWEQFDDPVLSGLVAAALGANPDLDRARATLHTARAQRSLTVSDVWPSASISAGRSSTDRSGDSPAAGSQTLYVASLDASWERTLFGAEASALRAAEADLEAAASDLDQVRVSLAAEVALNYVELRGLQARLGISNENLARQSETLELTTWRAAAGLTSELDVEQARTNLEQTRARIPDLETGIVQARHRLAVLTGQPPTNSDETLETSSPIPPVPVEVVTGIPADTLRRRPDVRAAEQRLVAAGARMDEAVAARYPTIRLSGSVGVEALTAGGLLDGETLVSSLISSLTAPLFDRRGIEGRIDVQRAARDEALASLRQTMLTALEEVENALVAVSGARQQKHALDAASVAARTAAELARNQYTAGLISYQAVLETERTVLAIDDERVSVEAKVATSTIRLFKALGGGWQASDDQPNTHQLQERRCENDDA